MHAIDSAHTIAMDRKILNAMRYPLPEEWKEEGDFQERLLHDKEGNLHDYEAPAVLKGQISIYDVIKYHIEEWRIHGVLHRIGGPALVKLQSWGTSGLYTIEYYHNGQLHRTDGPARIEVTPSGKLVKVEYYQHGELHRVDGPAVISHDYIAAQRMSERVDPGQPMISSLLYYQHGQLHREGGAAKSDFRLDNGEGFKTESWFLNGACYNPDGAASIWRDDKGRPELETFTNKEGCKTKSTSYFPAAYETADESEDALAIN